ncbi:MAG: tautomerase family protein [Desulfovibrionaceae bacterium]|nr:tautomerase family protein [Desulfovibrionaceae bacterium]MBF0513319.1 tautomerase family protein [Desulfovibrionaceae bacterium]
MPQVRINMIKGRSRAEKLAVSGVVRQAMASALGVPESGTNHRFVEFQREDWILPEGASERFVLIEATLFAGRSSQAKGDFYAAVTAGLTALGVPESDVLIVLIEGPRENWGLRGGQRADLIDMGYRVGV